MTRTQEEFDTGWTFHYGEFDLPPRRILSKGTTAGGFSDLAVDEIPTTAPANIIESFGPGFQTSIVKAQSKSGRWKDVKLPHDWRIELPQAPDHPEREDYPRAWQGYFPTGVGYYRKLFSRPLPNDDQRVELTFDGVAIQSEYWINGFYLGSHGSAYSPVTFDITEFLRENSEGPNVVLVRTDTTEAEGWWYEGGGIYRHVWLSTINAIHVARGGMFVTTPRVDQKNSQVTVDVEVVSEASRTARVGLQVSLVDPKGNPVGPSKSVTVDVPPLENTRCAIDFDILEPYLWDLGQGNLYRADIALSRDGLTIDEVSQNFGIRSLEWAVDGFRINGRLQRLYGANIHQDFAGLGVALPDRVIEAKLELLAEMGVNAVRSAHHPATPELIQHADRMGMLVLAENRVMSTAPAQLGYVSSHVKRFRSHPSILMWSLENEELNLEGRRAGTALLRRLVTITKKLDPTRATTVGGVAGLTDREYFGSVDVVGMHYQSVFGTLEQSLGALPNKPHIEDEEGLFASTRGVYEKNEMKRPSAFFTFSDLKDALGGLDGLSSHGNETTYDIAALMHGVFNHPRLAGAFIWSGLDYLGEPTGPWPAVSAAYGARDLIGLPKDYYWLLRALFRNEPIVHAFPHWSWSGREGQQIPFRVYANVQEVEVLVNGEAIACRTVVAGSARFEEGITYVPGTLLVRGYTNGEIVAEHEQHTPGEPAALLLQADRTDLAADGKDVAIVRAAIVDDRGLLVPTANHELRFKVEGCGSLIGVGNGDPSSIEAQKAPTRRAFNGWAGAVIQTSTAEGSIDLMVSTHGLPQAALRLVVSESSPVHVVHLAADESTSPGGTHRRCQTDPPLEPIHEMVQP